jgi:4-amino-4-deoxy-L-arabinose transferase-like glycosyltransferase
VPPVRPRRWGGSPSVLVVLAFATCLALFGLSNNAFWDDEANTALFARNLLSTGKLAAFDGTNVVGFRGGAELDSNLVNIYMPPVQYYVAALGLRLLGNTTLGGRLPFVIAGLACIAVLAALVKWHFRSHVPLWLSTLVLALNPAYLMFVRQCRYYAIVALLTIIVLAVWSHSKATRVARIVALTTGAAASTALMFTNYLNAVALAAVLPLFFVLRRYRTRANVYLACTVGLSMLLAGVYILQTANPLLVGVSYRDTITGWPRLGRLFWWHLSGLAQFEFFPVAVPILLLALILFVRRAEVTALVRESVLFCMALVVYSAAIVAFSPQTVTEWTKLADMRYSVALMPIGALVTAGTLSALWAASKRVGPVLSIVVGTMIIGTNAFTSAWGRWEPLRSTLVEYINENAHDYTTGNEAIIEFLKKLPRQYVIRVIPDFMAYPAMFYVPAQHYCCQLYDSYQSKTNPSLRLPEYVYTNRVLPDYILVGADVDPHLLILQTAAVYGAGRYALLPSVGTDYRDSSRPEIPWHSFGPPKDRRRGFSVLRKTGIN